VTQNEHRYCAFFCNNFCDNNVSQLPATSLDLSVPFTPFHLGPGAVFKAIGGNRFSFMVFGGSQVLIDIEPGVRMLVDTSIFHGPSHSIAGAFIIGLVAALIGKPISEFALRLLRVRHVGITWTASATGAFVGTFSHVFLDALTHSDMSPWFPLASSNELLGFISLASLQIVCLVLGVIGGILVLIRYKTRQNA